MSKKWTWIVFRALMGLILVGLIVGGGFAVYRMGWSRGYLARGAGGKTEVAPVGPMVPMHFGHRGLPFGPGRFLLSAGLVLLFFVAIGKVLRAVAWRGALMHGPWAGRPPGGWHGHRFHGPMPPGWCGPHGWWGGPPPDQAGQPGEGREPNATPEEQ